MKSRHLTRPVGPAPECRAGRYESRPQPEAMIDSCQCVLLAAGASDDGTGIEEAVASHPKGGLRLPTRGVPHCAALLTVC